MGVGPFDPDPDAVYPCDNQNSYGQLNVEVMEVNGYSPYDGGAESITAGGSPTCSMDESQAFYDGRIHITQVVSEHLTIDAYAFKNAEAQAAAELQHTMTIGTLDKCKLELIYKFKPKAGGGLDARVEVRQHAFGLPGQEMENTVNGAMATKTNKDENKLSIYAPKATLLAGAGLGPDGCGSFFPAEESVRRHQLATYPGRRLGLPHGTSSPSHRTHPSSFSSSAPPALIRLPPLPLPPSPCPPPSAPLPLPPQPALFHLVDVSLSFTCEATGAEVLGAFEWADNSLSLSLTAEQARLACHLCLTPRPLCLNLPSLSHPSCHLTP